jgi:AI-2 transport protein TqsA
VEHKVLRYLVGGASAVIIIAGLRAAAPLLVPLLVAIFLAMVTLPLVAALEKRRVPAGVAVLAAVLVVIAALAGPGIVVRQTAAQFVAAIPRYQERLFQMAAYIEERLAALGVEAGGVVAALDPNLLTDAVAFTVSGVVGMLSNLFVVLLTMAFILLEAASFERKLRVARAVPDGRYDYLSGVPGEVLRYVWVKTLISLATGILAGLWVGLLGLDFAILWGFLAFLLNYIPNFGSILAAIPPILLAAIQLGPGWALAVAAGYIVVNLVMGNIVEPQVMGRRMGLSPLVVLVSLFFWGWVWGPVGMLLSVPLTTVVKIVLENTAQTRWLAVLLSGDRDLKKQSP